MTKLWAGLLFTGDYDELWQYVLHNIHYVDGLLVVCDSISALNAVQKLAMNDTGIDLRYSYLATSKHSATEEFHYSRARNVLLGMAEVNDLVFMLDIDERIKTDLATTNTLTKEGMPLDVMMVTIVNHHSDIDATDFKIHAETIRIVRAGKVRYRFHVHERVEMPYYKHQIPLLPIDVIHTGYNLPVDALQEKARKRMKGLIYELVKATAKDDVLYLTHHIKNTGHFLGNNFYKSI